MGAMGAILNSNRLVEAVGKVGKDSVKVGTNVTASSCEIIFKASPNQPFEDWLGGAVSNASRDSCTKRLEVCSKFSWRT